MNYCKYRQSDGYILEISSDPLEEDGEVKVCMTTMEPLNTHHMYALEFNENNELIAHRGYLKDIGGG